MAANFEQLVLFRMLQGAMGAALLPMSQAILLDINPPERHGSALATWGIGVIIGPICGPVVGGWLTEVFDCDRRRGVKGKSVSGCVDPCRRLNREKNKQQM